MKPVIILFSILTCTAACNKALDLKPKDTISDGTFYKTASDFKLAANSLYNSLAGLNLNDTESDIAFNTVNAVSDGSYLPSETAASWTDAWYYIRNANYILMKGADKTDAGIKRFVAEAKFFRAYNYFNLLRLYGGAPLITQALDANDPLLYTKRSSRKETADLILKDLTEAVADLPLRSALASEDVGRITKGAADGLRARVALFEGTWSKFHNDGDANKYLDIAIAAANAVITSGEYDLYKGKGALSYRFLFIEEGDDSKESILDRRYEVNISGHGFPYTIDANCYLPTRKLVDMYLSKDGLPIDQSPLFQGYNTVSSEFNNRDPRMTMTMIIPGTSTLRPFFPVTPVVNWPTSPQRNGNTGYITYKYISDNVYGNTNNGSNFGYDNHIIRYAEVLMIYAEALFERNGLLSDADMDKTINLIRDRAGMPHLSNAFVSAHNLDLRKEIRRERTIEFALEGFRYDDLRRWKTAETEMKLDIKGIKIKGTDWQTIAPYSGAGYQSRTDADGFLIAQGAAARAFDPAKHYLRPLPTREIALYKGALEQNPNW